MVMKMPRNNISAVIDYFRSELSDLYDRYELDSMLFILLEHYFGLSKSEVLLDKDRKLSESELLKVIYAVKDLKKFKPLAYILGETEFYGLKIMVNEFTLIPRPETEELVALILNENNGALSILDIGTGSGCIALALAKNLRDSRVTAWDVSSKALTMVEQNANRLDIKVDTEEVDILSTERKEQFDIIVSNPPYIPFSDQEEMERNVLDYEPHLALFVENDNPLIFYQRIGEFALGSLAENGKLYFEIHERLGDKVKELLENLGYKKVMVHQDINGKDRMVSASV